MATFKANCDVVYFYFLEKVVVVQLPSCVQLFATLWTAARQIDKVLSISKKLCLFRVAFKNTLNLSFFGTF